MTSCRRVRRILLETVRGTASDASRLLADAHLNACPGCREERARWALVGLAKRAAPQRLDAAAERRILQSLTHTQAGSAKRTMGLGTRRAPRTSLALAAGVALAIAVGWFAVARGPRRSDEIADGFELRAKMPGTLLFSGAEIRYEPGTELTLHRATRTVSMRQGQIDLDVTPGARSGLFRVATSRFVVEVLGTSFRVTDNAVHTWRGKVRVADPMGRELALLRAGESWKLPPEPSVIAVAAPALQPAAGTVAAPGAAQPVVSRRLTARRAVASVDVSALIAQARTALAQGDSDTARAACDQALRTTLSRRETATVRLLRADSLLVARHFDDAISAYRAVVRLDPSAPQAETAAFAIAQLLAEHGSPAAARAAWEEYLARHPYGRFVREARERLDEARARP